MTTTEPAPRPPAPALAQRLWPDAPTPARAATVAAAGGAGAVAALALPGPPPGAGAVTVGALAAAAVAAQRGRAWSSPELGLAGLAVGLLTVAAVRDAAWLVALCVLASLALGALAVSHARTWTGALLTPVVSPVAAVRALRWVARTTSSPASGDLRRWVSLLGTAAVTTLLVGVFGALLASADAAFARLVDLALPDVRVGELPGRLVLGALVASVVLAGAYLAVAPPRWALVRVPAARGARRTEWLVPVGALDLLLLTFLVVQSAVLFGGRDHVLRTAGLTSAEYARQGFSQLLVVTALVLVVVAAAVRWAPRTEPRDRLAVRAGLGLLLALTLAVAASALMRLHLYEQAYGATRARLLAASVEVWLVLVLLLVAWAGARWPAAGLSDARWSLGSLPRAVAASAGLVLLALAAVDADALVARRNVDRYLAGAEMDTAYLGRLSADAVHELDRLPEPQRSCALTDIARRLASTSDSGWAGANLARSSARSLLASRPVQGGDPACTAGLRAARGSG